jgi:hypothetical protein
VNKTAETQTFGAEDSREIQMNEPKGKRLLDSFLREFPHSSIVFPH